MEAQRKVVIISESRYHTAVFRATLIEAGFAVEDQVDPADLPEYLKRNGDTSLLMIDRAMEATSAEDLLQEVLEAGTAPAGMRSLCLIHKPAGTLDMDGLKATGFAGAIPISASPEQIVFRVNDVVFSEAVKQRRNLRAPVSIPAAMIHEGQQVLGDIVSLSNSGLFLKSDHQLPVNSMVKMGFTLYAAGSQGEQRIVLDGRIIEVKKRTGTGDITLGAGMVVIFESPEESIKAQIDAYVAAELAIL